MRTLTALTLCVLMAAPAAAQSIGEKTGVNSLIGMAPSTQDFVTQAASSNMFEITSSKLAVEKADEPTKDYARKMIVDHEQVQDELKASVSGDKANVELPTKLVPSHQRKIETLEKMIPAAEFTKTYRSDQVTAHKEAIDLFKRYGEGGDNAELKAWANRTRPHLEEHLKMAQALDDKQQEPTPRTP